MPQSSLPTLFVSIRTHTRPHTHGHTHTATHTHTRPHTHTHTHTHKHTHTHTHTDTHIHTHDGKRLHNLIPTSERALLHRCVHHIKTCTHTRKPTPMCTNPIHTQTLSLAHTHTHTNIYTFSPTHTLTPNTHTHRKHTHTREPTSARNLFFSAAVSCGVPLFITTPGSPTRVACAKMTCLSGGEKKRQRTYRHRL